MPINIPGFIPASNNLKPYLRLTIEGWHRCGKSHFGLSGAPAPVGCIALDGNTEHVAHKIQESTGREIYVNKDFMVSSSLNVFASQAEHKRRWEAFKHLYFEQLLTSAFQTIIVDSGSDLWELTRLAEFGKLEKVPQFAYGEANHPWRQMINSCEKNLIITHKLAQYGTKVDRKGMEEVAFLSHAVIRLTRLPKGMRITEDPGDYEPTDRSIPVGYWDAQPGDGDFALKIMDSSHNPMLAGKILVGSEVSFKQVAMLMYPQTTSKNWK